MKLTLFMGLPVESFPIAYAARKNLRYPAEVTVWDRSVFQLSQSSLESLFAVLDCSDLVYSYFDRTISLSYAARKIEPFATMFYLNWDFL